MNHGGWEQEGLLSAPAFAFFCPTEASHRAFPSAPHCQLMPALQLRSSSIGRWLAVRLPHAALACNGAPVPVDRSVRNRPAMKSVG